MTDSMLVPEQEAEKEFVDQLLHKYTQYEDALKPVFDRAIIHWKRYICREPVQADPRDKDKEGWRSWIAVPKATANTNAVVSTVTNIITSSSPIIQAVKTRDLNTDDAAYAEKIVNYVFKGNKLRSRIIPQLIRHAEIQGMQPLKMSWQDRSRSVLTVPTIAEYENFWNAVLSKAKELNVEYPDPKVDPEGFEVWLDTMRSGGHTIPEMPKPTTATVSAYKGPWYTLPSFFNVLYNPFIADEQEQEVIFERTVLPLSYVEALADDEEDSPLPYSKSAVEYAKQRMHRERFNTHERQYLELRGYNTQVITADAEPFIEVIEAYMPAQPDIQFAAIANRCAIINKVRTNPLPTGDHPFVFVHRVRSGDAVGFTPYESNGNLLDEVNTLRSSRLDIVSLTSVPIFTAVGSHLSDVTSIGDLKSGAVRSVGNHNDLKQVDINVPSELFRESNELDQTIDLGWGVGGNVRGQQATVNRVSLGEHQSRLTQATLPLIEFAREIEDKLETTLPWIFSFFQQYADEETKFKLQHKFEMVDPVKIAKTLEMDFQFTGATQAGNRGELAQIIFMWYKTVGESLMPEEKRQIAKVTAGLMGIPDMQTIIQDQPMMDPNAMANMASMPGGAPNMPMPLPTNNPPMEDAAPLGNPLEQ